MLYRNQELSAILTATVLIAFFTTSSGALQSSDGYRARLSPMPTTPQTASTITGAGEVRINLEGTTLTASGTFSGMSSDATSAHIHYGLPAQPGPVVHQLDFSAMTHGELSATIKLSQDQIAALKSASLYIQIHSKTNPAGELRGWIFRDEK